MLILVQLKLAKKVQVVGNLKFYMTLNYIDKNIKNLISPNTRNKVVMVTFFLIN